MGKVDPSWPSVDNAHRISASGEIANTSEVRRSGFEIFSSQKIGLEEKLVLVVLLRIVRVAGRRTARGKTRTIRARRRNWPLPLVYVRLLASPSPAVL